MKQTIETMSYSNSLKHNPSYRETADVLREHLRKQQQCRKRSQNPPTTSDIKQDAAQILEKFLKQELKKSSNTYPILDSHYQRVEEEDLVIRESPTKKRASTNSLGSKQTSSTKSGKISIYSLTQDDIDLPFADEDVETELEVPEKSRSLPSSINNAVNQNKIPARSARSLSPSSSTKIQKPDNHITPQIDIICPPDHTRPKSSKSTTPARSDKVALSDYEGRKKRHRSGSISSGDTDSPEEVISPDRKKKSIFKRAKERLNSFIQRKRSQQRKDSRKIYDVDNEKPKRTRKRNKNGKKNSLVLTERQTHRYGHVEQHRFKNGDQTGILRSEETWESTDINDKENRKQKHIDRHRNVKESTDLSTSSGGIFGTLKRLSLKKSKKDRSKSRTSACGPNQVHRKQDSGSSYDQSVSLYDGDKNSTLNLHTETERRDSNTQSHIHSTSVITRERDYIETGDKAIVGLPKASSRRNKPSNRENQGTGSIITDKRLSGVLTGLNDISDRALTEERILRRHSGLDLPKSDSFTLDYELDETVKAVKHKDGSIDLDTDKHIRQHIPVHGPLPDLEIDGLDDIGEIANRIAEIGDSYVQHARTQSESEPSSPIASSSGHVLSASSSSRDGEGLNSLERELRDYLRSFGDNISKKVDISDQTKEAAKEMARQATYNMFKDTFERTLGDDVGWDQLAMLFYFTKKGIQLAGAGGAVAVQIKENCLRYVEDKFAKWIVNQGGWDSVLTDTETSTDSELD
ncbi:hypothetical protein KUTeg_007396 [Tegillarca granosa]|uniref:Uncharacterized protein n=1 Tax=Tegillarca granosa TaxID=220873 RepID=A0ABQ9FD69_TEGGR|nr:hypothetical protein KUTeg_007396 [Tegillarca granosa]